MLSNIVIGLIIGVGLILPGVSGGVIAVILNVYDSLVYSMHNLFKEPKKSLKLLIPIGIGVCIGAFLIGKLINYLLFEKNYIETYFVFIGLILGSIPALLDNTKEKGKINYILIFITFILSLSLFIFGKDTINLSVGNTNSFLSLFLTGFIFILGKVVPGISSSFILMLIGTYEYFLSVITNPIDMISSRALELIPITLGILLGLVIFIKIMNYLLKKHYGNTYSAIIGFVLGSVIAIYPGITLDIHGILSIILLIISFMFSYKFSKYKKD